MYVVHVPVGLSASLMVLYLCDLLVMVPNLVMSNRLGLVLSVA